MTSIEKVLVAVIVVLVIATTSVASYKAGERALLHAALDGKTNLCFSKKQ